MISSRKVIFLLDFDGTLSPIVKNPKYAVLPRKIKKWLKTLSRQDGVKIAIVTGRTMKDIRQRIGIPGIIYAANHGMEIYYRGRFVLLKGKRFRKPLALLVQKLESSLSGIPGVFVENKGLSVAVHLRRMEIRFHRKVNDIVTTISEPWMNKYGLTLTQGKLALEIRPAVMWDKGKAVLWIWRHFAPHHLPVYVGDDTTDEDAFIALRPCGVTIRIGKKKSSYAQYSIPSISKIIGST